MLVQVVDGVGFTFDNNPNKAPWETNSPTMAPAAAAEGNNATAVVPADPPPSWPAPTMDTFFERIESAIKYDSLAGVEYDSKYGYPTWIDIDHPATVDEETTYWVKLLESY